jgi:hypothetical protein
MPYIDLTEEEHHWLSVAVEQLKDSAEKLVSAAGDDEEDAMDANYLVTVWAGLQAKFPPPEISLEDLGGEEGPR